MISALMLSFFRKLPPKEQVTWIEEGLKELEGMMKKPDPLRLLPVATDKEVWLEPSETTTTLDW